MDRKTALNIISDGHLIISPEKAQEVCLFFKVPFVEYLVHKWKSDKPGTFKGLTMEPSFENADGVYTLNLSSYIADKLGVKEKAGVFYGRGSQAQAYAKEIEKVIS